MQRRATDVADMQQCLPIKDPRDYRLFTMTFRIKLAQCLATRLAEGNSGFGIKFGEAVWKY